MDQKIHHFLLAGILLVSGSKITGQVTITGEVHDQHNQPVPFATATFLSPQDSSLVEWALTDTSGLFSLKSAEGKYILHIFCLGFHDYYTEIILNKLNYQEDRQIFYLTEDFKHLDAAVIRAQKPFFERKADRIDINVQNSGVSGGSSILDILSKSPGVVINRQSSNIMMNGKSGAMIQINGKESKLPSDALVQMLEGMNSANVEKIELIAAPPSRYDAAGEAGIINIVLKSNQAQGVNGNIGLNTGYQHGPSWGVNFLLNQRNGRLNTFVNYSFRSSRTINYWENDKYLTINNYRQSDITFSRRKPYTRLHDLHTGAEYLFGKSTKASVMLNFYENNWDMNATTRNTLSLTPDSNRLTIMSIREINNWRNASANMELSQQLSPRQMISGSFDYLYYINNNPSGYDNKITLNSSASDKYEEIQVSKKTPVKFKVIGLNYQYGSDTAFSIEAGLKGTLSNFSNNVQVTRSDSLNLLTDADNSNHTMLDETIWAGYASWKWIVNASLSINGGVRYEHTHTLLRSDDGQELVNRSSGELFPSLYVIYSINPKNRIQLTYNKRITRPSFNDMAPFVFFIGPGTFVAGNLNLKPAIVQNIDLSYHFGHLWFSLRYSHSDNEIAMFQPEIDPQTNEQIFRTRNMEYLKTFGINTLFPVRITSWWKMQNDFSIYFYSGKTKQSGNTILQKKESMAFNIINTLSLPMNLTAELSASYQSGSFMGISHYRLSGPQVVAGIKKVLKNNASLSIIANDIFNGSKWNLTTRSDELDFISRWSYDWGGRSIILSYSHSFGNKNLKEVKINSRSIEEQGRVR